MRGLTLLCMLLVSCGAVAGNNDAIPTCYNAKIPARNPVLDTEIFLIIDQTTLFDDGLKQLIADNVRPFLKPGNAFSVSQFSAFIQGHYTEVLVSGKLDAMLPKSVRDDISKPALATFDRCVANQLSAAGQLVGRAMKDAFAGSSSDIAKSDILSSLKDISSSVRKSAAQRKIVLMASDMLENSSISSFYSNQGVRHINPEKELKLVSDNQLFGDFGGAKVYVIGAGLLPDDIKQKKGAYRPAQSMQALSSFWSAYFEKSNAGLTEFGQPALLNPIR